MTENELNKQQEVLDNEMSKIWEKPFLDGITDFELNQKMPKKILWILKEPNGMGGGNQRLFHLDIRDYKYWKSTYGNIMRVSFGIREGINIYKDIPPINTKECEITDAIVLDEIAIINVNKSGGRSTTPFGKMAKEYNRVGVKDFLFKQIEFINPDIIINTHGVKQFFIDQVGNNEIKKINAEEYAINKNRLIIWTTHPNRAPVESYCNNILNIINNVKSKNNGI